MALVNEILASRYNQMLAKLLGLKTDRSPAPQLAPEIGPSFEVESDRPEWAQLKGETIWAAQVTVAGAALNHSIAGIFNPIASQKLVVVTFCRVVPLTTTLVQFGSSSSAIAPAGIISPIDSRAPGFLTSGRTVAQIVAGNGNPASQISNVHDEDQYTTGAAGLVNVDLGRRAIAILPPGFTWVAELVTVNIGSSFSFKGYERPFEPGELNP